MKKHIIHIAFALLGMAAVFSSCNDEAEEIVRTLEIEKQFFILDYKGQSIDVGVTADDLFQAEWIGEGWGSIQTQNDRITITVDENTGNTVRYASVRVFLSNELRTRVIDIAQNGNNPELNIVPDNIHFALIGGEYVFQVESDLNTWEISTDASWITSESFFRSNELVIRAERNDVMEAKAAKVMISIGSGEKIASKEIEVTIDPLTRYFLPFYDFNGTTADDILEGIKAYLEAPDLYCEYFGGASMINSFHWFKSNSPIYPLIRYQIITGRMAAFSATLLIAEEYEYDEQVVNDMSDLLIESGFEFLFSNQNGQYFWKEVSDVTGSYQCLGRIAYDGYVYFTADKVKPVVSDGPTFDTIPLPELSWGINKNAVVAWEAANGGNMIDDTSGTLTYEIPASTEYFMRWYSFEDYSTADYENLVEISVVYEESELSKFFTKVAVYGFIINNRLMDLFINSGYAFLGYDSYGVPAFYDASKKTAIAIKGYTDDGTSTPKYGSFMYFKYDPNVSGKSVMSVLDSINAKTKTGDLKIVPINVLND